MTFFTFKRCFTLISIFILWKIAPGQVHFQHLSDTLFEHFNTLSETGTQNTWEQNSTLKGWYAYRGNNTLPVTQYRADDGSSNAGGLYSYGNNSDRALGSLASGSTGTVTFGLRMKNLTPQTITSVHIKFTAEQWRVASTITNHLACYYKIKDEFNGLNADEIAGLDGFVPIPELTVASLKLNATATKLNGKSNDNRAAYVATIFVVWKPGQEIFLRWDDEDNTGSDHGLAMDDLQIYVSNEDKAPPEVIHTVFQKDGTLHITFNEPVELTDATNLLNYAFSPALQVQSASYLPAKYTVVLEIQPQMGTYYQLTILRMSDSAAPPNTLRMDTIPDLVFNPYNGDGLVITEIMYDNPGPDFLEFIELYNRSNESIPMGGLRFIMGLQWKMPPITLMPDSFLLISRTKDSMDVYFNLSSFEWAEGALGNFNTNTRIVLENTLSDILIDITYQPTGDWPSSAQGKGPSLEYLNLTLPQTSGSSWTPATDFACIFRGDSVFATPGYANFSLSNASTPPSKMPRPNSEPKVYPNPFGPEVCISLSEEWWTPHVTASLYSFTNQLVFEGKYLQHQPLRIDTPCLSPGLYLLTVSNGIHQWRTTLIKSN
jgi:hypothetical protein